MNKFEKQAYYIGAQAALRDMGLSKTAAGVGFLDDIGAAISGYTGRAARYIDPDDAVTGAFRQGLGNRLQGASNWMGDNARLTGGLALGAGAGALGLGGYALLPEEKPWYHFGMG